MKRRGDFGWRGWGAHWQYGSWYALETPLGGCGINHFRRQRTSMVSRGRCLGWVLNIRLVGDWQLEFTTRGKTYLKLVNGPKELRNIDWILDEFDACFNDLACASLRYHLNWSVCNNEDRRGHYEDLIRRLSESPPEVCETPEEHAIIKAAFQFPLNEHETPESRAILDRYNDREDSYLRRINQARHDFVEIMPALWS